MSGMFTSEQGRTYEIDIPSPYIRNSEKEAMGDGGFGYRFIPNENGKPIIGIYSSEEFELAENKQSLAIWVVGNPIATYDWETFRVNGGYIRKLKEEREGSCYIDGNTDFEDTSETFDMLFPNIQKKEYIDDEAYYIQEIE
jgi:hypothetical protein